MSSRSRRSSRPGLEKTIGVVVSITVLYSIFLSTVPAAAQTAPSITTDAATYESPATVTIGGSGWLPSGSVDVIADDGTSAETQSAPTDAYGDFSLKLSVDTGVAADFTLTASGSDPAGTGATATASFTVTAPTATTSGEEPAGGTSTTEDVVATIESNRFDYFPGDHVILRGSNWLPGEGVHIFVDDSDNHTWQRDVVVVADEVGDIVDEFDLPENWVANYAVVATGLTSGREAFTTFTDAPASLANDFRQCANYDPTSPIAPDYEEACYWINGILQGSNSDYVEGMVVPQRVVLPDVKASLGNLHTLFFSHQATKSGDAHAYDFITSWDDAIDTAVELGGFTDLDLNVCGVSISATAQTACNAVVSDTSYPSSLAGAYSILVPVPDDPYDSAIFTFGDGEYQDRIDAYEGRFGDRYIEIFGNAPITAASLSLSHSEATDVSADDDIEYALNWTSESTIIVVAYGGHIAVGYDGTGVSWGQGVGASGISGGPYHQYLTGYEFFSPDPGDIQDPDEPEFISLGKQDNQIMAASILAPGFKSGYKWDDQNGNGVKDGGEPYLDGWTMTLYRDLDLDSVPDPGEVVGTAMTGAGSWPDGYYEFFPITPDDDDTQADEGKYIVCETLQPGWNQTYPDAGSTPPSGTTPSGGTVAETIVDCGDTYGYRFDVSDGEVYDDDHFGNRGQGTKEGFKYEDENANGNFDAGTDTKLSGWQVFAVHDDNADGQMDPGEMSDALSTTTADGSGSLALGAYKFTLTAGKWFVCEESRAASGWFQSSPQNGDTGYTGECDDQNGGFDPDLATGGYYINVTGGSTDVDNEFGNYKNGTKSGFKYEDLNADSDKNGLDANITTGWTIYAIHDVNGDGEMDAADALTEIHQDTDGSGSYSFSLPPAKYFICEESNAAAGWFQSSPKTGDTDFTAECGDADAPAGLASGGYYITVTSQSSDTGNEFGNFKNGSKTGFKYEDLNADSDKNGLDASLPDWTIYAIHDVNGDGEMDAADAATAAGQDTDASGNYSFSLAPGKYFICEESNALDGWMQSSPKAGDTDFTAECGDPDAPAGLASGGYYITVTSQSSDTGNEFGNFKSGSKTGFKYEDEAADGNYNAGTDGLLDGWKIFAIHDDNGDGQLDAGELTDAQMTTTAVGTGAYSFALPPGKWFVCEETGGAGWFQSSPVSGDTDYTAECDDQQAAADPDLATGGYYITVTSQSTDANNEFGNFKNGSKSGFKYEDEAADGNYDSGTDGLLEGWNIYAIHDDNGDGELQAGELSDWILDETDASGAYSFSLPPGKYFVCEETGATGWSQSSPVSGDGQFTDKCDDQNGTADPDLAIGGYYITVTSQSSDTNNEFGNFKNGSKSGFKYEDEAADGNYNAGTDALLEGWQIFAIEDDNGDGFLDAGELSDAVSDTTAAVSGVYSFSLPPGKYFICEETGGTGWLQSSPVSGDADYTGECDDQNATANPDLATGGYYITVTSQSSDTNNEFGNYENGTKSGFKYEDLNADSDKNGLDANITGWTIYAIHDVNGDGEMDAAGALTETHQDTDGSGNYSFSLPPGKYFICEETGAAGWTQSSPKVGDTDFTAECGDEDAPAGLASGGYYITVTSQSEDTGNEFGNFKTGSKSGLKYEDEDADGEFEAGDGLLEGWNIYAIHDDNGNGELEAGELSDWILDETDAVTGAYSFSLPPGKYFICEETGGTGWSQSSPESGDTDLTDKCDDQNATANPDLAVNGYYITVTSQSSDTGNEFGNFKNGSKSGFKYEDEDADGEFEAGDGLLTSWNIYAIHDDNGNGELEAGELSDWILDETDAGTGAYSFSLPPGKYFICEETGGVGWFQSSPESGDTDLTDKCDDQNATANPDLAVNGYYITVTSQSEDTGNEFGNFKNGSKEGFKYEDEAANGNYDAGTDGLLEGWNIYAIHDDNGDGELQAGELSDWILDETDAVTGAYSFSLPPGKYFVCEETGATGWSQSSPVSGDGQFTDKCDDQNGTADPDLATGGYYITVTSQSSDTNNEFGNFRQGTKSGIKFDSEDGKGPFEVAEDTPVAGWTIYLYADANGNGIVDAGEKTPIDSTVTDADDGLGDGLAFAEYEFVLDPGKYVVCEAAATGWVQSFPTAAEVTNEADCALAEDDGGTPSADNVEDVGYKFTITSFSEETGNDFGNFQPVKVRVTKTVSLGPIPAGVTFTFQIRREATPDPNGPNGGDGYLIASGDATSADAVVGPDDWTIEAGETYPLVPGTYQLCEVIVNGYTPSFVSGATGYGTGPGEWFSPGITDELNLPNDLANTLACFTFTVSSGDGGEDHTVDFTVDNQPPGMNRTIGYWKNWTSCDGKGNQDDVLDQMIAIATDNWIPNGEPISGTDGLTDIRIGDRVIQGEDACAIAVDILDKRLLKDLSVVGDGKKIASSPAWNAASQLLAYELNQLLNPGSTCAAADTAAEYTRRILNKIHFTGSQNPTMSKNEKAALNYYAGILDNFNNNTLGCGMTVDLKPGTPGASYNYLP